MIGGGAAALTTSGLAASFGARTLLVERDRALKHGISLRNIVDTIHAYPTLALGARRVADQRVASSD